MWSHKGKCKTRPIHWTKRTLLNHSRPWCSHFTINSWVLLWTPEWSHGIILKHCWSFMEYSGAQIAVDYDLLQPSKKLLCCRSILCIYSAQQTYLAIREMYSIGMTPNWHLIPAICKMKKKQLLSKYIKIIVQICLLSSIHNINLIGIINCTLQFSRNFHLTSFN